MVPKQSRKSEGRAAAILGEESSGKTSGGTPGTERRIGERTMIQGYNKAIIYPLLHDAAHPTPGRILETRLQMTRHNLDAQIQRERRAGYPILADSRGFYAARTTAEIDNYCDRLKHRAVEIFRTRQAIIKKATAPEE